MPFVSEFASTSDAEKFDLDGVWARYFRPRAGDKDPLFRYAWTVNRETNDYLLLVETGWEDTRNRFTFVFYTEGHLIEIILDRFASKTAEGTTISRWKIIKITPFDSEPLNIPKVKDNLKVALEVHQVRGIVDPLKNHLATFEF